MEAIKTTKKKNYHRRLNSYLPLKFKKFQMQMDNFGVHILISANFLKKGNHSLKIQNGILHLKIKQATGLFGYAIDSASQKDQYKDMDFQISLPHKKFRHINSVRYQNGSLQIHLSDRQGSRDGIKYVGPSTMFHRSTSSIRH